MLDFFDSKNDLNVIEKKKIPFFYLIFAYILGNKFLALVLIKYLSLI